MNLDLHRDYPKIDRENMYGHIQSLPEQLDLAWQLGKKHDLPSATHIKNMIIVGMGGSAIGADLIASYALNKSRFSITVHRGYGLPAWVSSQETLVIASSHSGNTEETLSAYQAASSRKVPRLAVCTGGRLAEMAEKDGSPIWYFEHEGQPRAAVGFSFGLLLALIYRLGFIENPGDPLKKAIDLMRQQQAKWIAEKPILENEAKQFALRIADKLPVILGADHLIPIARRWKGQFNELAKSWAQFEELPEADHNSLAGTQHPSAGLSHLKMILLNSEFCYPRNQLRILLTEEALKRGGLDVEVYKTTGDDELSSMWSALYLGDFIAYYLALLKNVDPTPIETMNTLKKEMKAVPFI